MANAAFISFLEIIFWMLPHFKFVKTLKNKYHYYYLYFINWDTVGWSNFFKIALSCMDRSPFLLCSHINLCVFHCIIIIAWLICDRRNNYERISLAMFRDTSMRVNRLRWGHWKGITRKSWANTTINYKKSGNKLLKTSVIRTTFSVLVTLLNQQTPLSLFF